MNTAAIQEIFRYHEETKHHYHRYARSLGYMDWENQPNPFRFYADTDVIELSLLERDPDSDYSDLFARHNNPSSPFQLNRIAGFLELSLGLSAWKSIGGSRWSLRINPSSGNLHPTESHLVLPAIDGCDSGVYHYNVLLHALETRAHLPVQLWDAIESQFATPGFLIALSSIYWRESWKYGERAFRYCNHDIGHALAAVSFAANLFGWRVTYLGRLSDDDIDRVLGFDKARFPSLEEEHADVLCWVHPNDKADIPLGLPDGILNAFETIEFQGTPNDLSPEHVNWETIYRTAAQTRKPRTQAKPILLGETSGIDPIHDLPPGAQIIRQRRSATGFDRQASTSKAHFLALLDKTIPRRDRAPFDIGLMQPAIDLMIFVHHVEGLPAGLYYFLRASNSVDQIKALSKPEFEWQRVANNFPLYLLMTGNRRQEATMVSCHQDIAGSSIFSLGMIAKFEETLLEAPYRYRHLFWESGMIGQVLYLEAEARGMRGTGIGCFFDDAVHEIMGFRDKGYQSLYHFTIGRPLEDRRLTTHPPYHHLQNR